ncbi:hypothetical protein [Paraburkholderia youngii]|uniref:Uncharacterized protein n=1 Tax=Paraburkholderia youngii TaxID=2782701 RepID=A0A7W8L8F1_9BURK|nr:hypothetical protein [Paraburkholderia youngii]MBB5402312.1 hypothetical protein [Paraburkholderia youngii]
MQLKETALFASDAHCHSARKPHRYRYGAVHHCAGDRPPCIIRFSSPHAICAAFALVRQASLDIRHTPIVPPDGMRKLRRYALLKRYDLIAARR